MNAYRFFECLLFFLWLTWLDGSQCSGAAVEPSGGLFDVALSPSEVGDGWTRRVRLALDPQSNTKAYYPNKEDMPGTPAKLVDPVDPAAPFRKGLDQVGAEAVIYLAYGPESPTSLYVKVLRFSSAKRAETLWTLRQKSGESELLSIAGQEILATKPGKHLRPDLNARMDTVECRSGRYVLRVAPARPLLGDPGLDWALKQLEKIRKISEPVSAASQSQPSRSETNAKSTAAGPGR